MRAVTRYATAGALVLAALPAASATATTPATGTTARADVTVPEVWGTVLAAARARERGIAFADCPESEMLPESLRCGTFTVPVDYAHPYGPRIELAVSRTAATGSPSERQGALVYDPGGPGAASITFPLVGDWAAWRKTARAYDLVGYAPRGVAPSPALSCRPPEEAAGAPTDSPQQPSSAYKGERTVLAKAYADGCALAAGPALRHYSSLDGARDLEVLRAALGEPRLTFMGTDQGAYVGALYATLFPSHVRRMVFDSPLDPDARRIGYRSGLARSRALESRFEDFLSWVARHDDVYGLGTTAGAVRGRYDEVRTALSRNPAGGKVGTAQLQAAFLAAAYYDDYWAMRASALSAYVEGDPEPLITQASPRPYTAKGDENAEAVRTAVECNDGVWPADWPTWDRDHTRAARRAPFATWAGAWANLPCASWPVPRRQPLDVRTGRGELPSVLVLAAERDGVTPYAGAVELVRRLPGAALVTERDAGSHGIGGADNACVNGHLETYLLTGRVPERDTECAPHPEPNPVSLHRAVPRDAGPQSLLRGEPGV
ncbi:alpha/beta hydrolase [Streptomyces sp. NBC_00102]|uniref:alpha/beta hydrolase n=1 Tax=Streptomyces sp. NBC_00102 TaxID=2975652 RepID=UPI0022551323|nr:alpha/beta hydrolase [Streptomyces sp. NBC_00102]MCX5400531.1 alpha/beta hydrolase [Streptomyces sp. NBC_00102]